MLPSDTDTIAAISTGLTQSGIGIVRVSGEHAVEIADRVFSTRSGRHILTGVPTHTIHYGFIRDGEEILDEVMATVMRAPRSFTTQDTVEINCHGGVYAMKRVLEEVIRAGARPAQPGEFTKRAFLNGRIDLTQAEAVMDLIESGNDYALRSSAGQLRGSLRHVIEDIRADVLHETAAIEASLDDPEHYSLDGYADQLRVCNQRWMDQLQSLISTFDNGRMIQEGIVTAIVGRPNAGKSSLLNALLGEERAIVTEVAGTTRDVITERLALNGITLIIRDTAGIRHTHDLVEQIGVDRARESIQEADLVLFVIDASSEPDENDLDILHLIHDKKAIIVLNKSDLPERISAEQIRVLSGDPGIPVVSVSAKEQTGLQKLTDLITNLFRQGNISFNDQVMISNIRQKKKLQEALESLRALQESIDAGMPEDFFSIDMKAVCEALGEITGENASEDLINEIFSKFCMGK